MTAVDELLAAARREIGKPYVYGAEGPTSFDCSGLMQWVFAKIGIKLPRVAAEQQRFATPVTNPQPGDLVFFGRPAHHVGLYVGGGRMIAAPHTGALVREQAIGSGATYGRISGLGAATAPYLGAVEGTVQTGLGGLVNTSFSVDEFLGRARGTVLQATAAVFGLALLGLGLYRLVKPHITGALGGE